VIYILSYELYGIESAERLVSFCRKFSEDIDVVYQRYTIDAKSVLGVTSLIGNIVTLEIITMDDDVKEIFSKGLKELQEGKCTK